MKILMSGATGLIGKEVGKLLVEKGHTVTALVRDVEKARQALPFPATLVKWEVGDEVPAVAGIDGVINLAGDPISGRWTEEKKKKVIDSRVLGTRALVKAFPDVKVFVSGSAIGYYGARGDEALDETSAAGNGFLAEVAEKWEAELAPLTKSRVVAIRTAVVFSRHGGALEMMLPLFEKGVAGNLGSGKQWMSWIHLDDISRLFVFALENETVVGPVNGSSPEPVKNDRFTVELARALDKPVFLPVPEAALKVTLGEMSSMILDSQKVIPRRARQVGFEFKYPEIGEALREITAPLKGGQHELFSEQWLPLKPEELFPFFKDEKNLETLTPPFLKFKVLDKSTPEIREGTLINYKLSLHGLPFKWQTRIESWEPNKRFVDTQLKGPYQKWYHEHDFIPLGGGTLVRDRVTYKLPLGFIGDTLAGWKVSGDVGKIFDYRRTVIDKEFGQKKERRP